MSFSKQRRRSGAQLVGHSMMSGEVDAVLQVWVVGLALPQGRGLGSKEVDWTGWGCLEMRGEHCRGLLLDHKVVLGHGLLQTGQRFALQVIYFGPIGRWFSVHEEKELPVSKVLVIVVHGAAGGQDL